MVLSFCLVCIIVSSSLIVLLCLFDFLLPLYFYQTDGSVPNTLVIANCEVVKPRVAAAEHIAQVILLIVNMFLFNDAFWLFS